MTSLYLSDAVLFTDENVYKKIVTTSLHYGSCDNFLYDF